MADDNKSSVIFFDPNKVETNVSDNYNLFYSFQIFSYV